MITLTHKEVLIIKDMDESTSTEEVAQAIAGVTGSQAVAPECVKLRKSYNGTQAASVLLPVAQAKKLLNSGKLRIGWVNCRVGRRETPSRCFRCHENGHIAKDCKSTVDRSTQCFRCSREGHNVVDCMSHNNEKPTEDGTTNSSNG